MGTSLPLPVNVLALPQIVTLQIYIFAASHLKSKTVNLKIASIIK